MVRFLRVLIFAAFIIVAKADDDLKDFIFSDPDEVMIAQESRQHQTVVQPPVRIVKPTGVTNSHRPQYNLDSFEEIFHDSNEEPNSPRLSLVKNYKSSNNIRAKEGMIKDAVLKALERKDHVGKFAQILPIIRAMSGSQRVALASLVASQVTTPPGRTPLNLLQVRSMFSNNDNTTELMLPIILDTANLIRRAVRPGKEPREVTIPYPSQQILRRSDTEDYELDDEPFDMGVEYTYEQSKHTDNRNIQNASTRKETNNKTNINDNLNPNSSLSSKTEPINSSMKSGYFNDSRVDNTTLDLMTEATNQTLIQDLPIAEKLRILSRYNNRKNNFRRGNYQPKTPSPIARRTTPEPAPPSQPVTRRRPTLPGQLPTKRKLPSTPIDSNKCELFTNTLCLNSDDYPTEAIISSIRRNKATAAALLADYIDPAEGVIDGVTAAQEAKYNEKHYLVSNRRGDSANRDFAGAGEAGFMCPSTVKYARPQRARATSGQWKYIVNTGEHTQTLRLEKCLKPKEPCTYLTDNFQSKCVQVYNYHRLLTWDQQNGLHMDIFKVPTCCSCHIEGYSIAFPPLGHRIQETSSEHFPGEDLSSEQGNHAFENVQSTILKPALKNPPFTLKKPLEPFPSFSDSQNLIPGSPFSKQNDNDDSLSSNPIDSYGNTYFPDSFNQASNVRQIKRPSSARNPPTQNFDEVTLPSFLEPPTPSATATFNFNKDSAPKFKFAGNSYKRTQRPSLANRIRPIRKKISEGPDDLLSSGTQTVESYPDSSADETEEISDFEKPDIGQATIVSNNSKSKITIAPKLQATTEKADNMQKSKNAGTNENFSQHGKRINYNYHPIIDFFDGDREIETDDAIDREDREPSYTQVSETEWKPINHPTSRTSHTNTDGRKKQK